MDFLTQAKNDLNSLITERADKYAALQTILGTAADEQRSDLNEDETVAFDEARAAVDALDASIEAKEARVAELEAMEARARTAAPVPFTYIPDHKDDDPIDARSIRKLGAAERRNRALRVIEDEDKRGAVGLRPEQKDALDALLRKAPSRGFNPDHVATRMIVTENPAYHSAFTKAVASGLTGRSAAFTPEEAAALNTFDEARAAAGQVDTAGGYGVPVLIDPTMIFTSQGHNAVVLRHCDIKTITTDQWKGVATAGMAFSFDDEGAEVSDDTMTLSQPSIPVWTTRGFLPFSVEVEMDYPGLIGDLQMALDMGFNDDLAKYTATGTGSSQPTGWQTKLDATTTSEVVVTTDGGFSGEDVSKVWKELPERFRPNATWFMHTDVGEAINAFATDTNLAWFTNDLTGQLELLRRRPVEFSDYLQSFVSGSTGALNILSVGDARGYSFVRRIGMTIEAVPHLFGTSNAGRPKLQRGILAYARWGADFTNTNAARLLQNQ